MEHQRLTGIVAQCIHDTLQLLRLCDLKDQLAAGRFIRRNPVKLHTERPLEQPGQPGGKVGALGNEPHLRGAEGIAVEQHAVGLGPCAAQALHRRPAQLVFHLSRK